MREYELWFADAPELTPDAAFEILGFLYEFVNAFENRYANQLRRANPESDCVTRDLFAEFDDDIP